MGVNCCAPSDVPATIATAREVTAKPVIIYPNSGEGWDAQRRTWAGAVGLRRVDIGNIARAVVSEG